MAPNRHRRSPVVRTARLENTAARDRCQAQPLQPDVNKDEMFIPRGNKL